MTNTKNKFEVGESAIIIKMGKDNFMAQVVPCLIFHNMMKGSMDPVYQVVLKNGQKVEAFETQLFTQKEAEKELKLKEII
tara:strand:- start:1519 stop:1758 length:240 start_codon:yes stop_codon:yes gene_type:complete